MAPAAVRMAERPAGPTRRPRRCVSAQPPPSRGCSRQFVTVLLCAVAGQWRRPRCRPSQRGEDEVKLAVRHDPDRDQVRRGPTQVRGWQWLRWEMSLCGPLRPALKA